MTKQRRLVYEIVLSSDDHLSAEEIHEKAKKIMPNIAMGTVYRNLSFLAGKGKIRRISMADSPDRYDGVLTPHEHFICEFCGELEDIRLPGLEEFLINRVGKKMTGYELNLFHVCKKCEKEEI